MLLKRSTPKLEDHHSLSTRRLWIEFLKRPKPKNESPNSTTRHFLVDLLKTPPRFSLSAAMAWFRRTWKGFQMFLKANPKTDTVRKPNALYFKNVVIRDFKSKAVLGSGFAVRYLSLYWKPFLTTLTLTPVVLELLLQSSSLMAWSFLEMRQRTVARNHKIIVCVGDYFTGGKYTRDPRRPFAIYLSQFLESQATWSLLNSQTDYLTTYDLLEKLPEVLEYQKPNLVYILIGIHDVVPNPIKESDPIPEAARSQTLNPATVYRTATLIEVWRDSRSISNLFDVLSSPPFYVTRKSPLLSGLELSFSDSEFDKVLKAVRGSADFSEDSDQAFGGGWDLLRKDAVDLALNEFENRLTREPEDPLLHAGLAEAYFKLGQHQKANTEVVWLTKKYQKAPNPKSVSALAHAYPLVRSNQDTSRVVLELVSRYPGNPRLWKTLARCSFVAGRQVVAQKAIDRALELTPIATSGFRAELTRDRARILAAVQPESALQELMQAFLLDGKQDVFIDFFRRDVQRYLRLPFRNVVNRLACSQEKKDELVSLLNEASDAKVLSRLSLFEFRLREIVRLCRDHDAQAVFLTYPIPPQPAVEQSTRRVAEETGSIWLNLRDRFEMLLKTGRVKDQYIKRGYLTEESSRVIAEWITSDVNLRELR